MDPTALPRSRALITLGLVSAIITAHEVLITRLLSVVTWYGLAFFVLSLAMLGLTAGSLQAFQAREEGAPVGPWVARRALWLAVAIVGSAAVTLAVPMTTDTSVTGFAAILAVALANAAPMVAGGAVVARVMAEADAPIGQIYAVDLVCAALGALAPLALLGPLDAPSALIVLGAAAAVASVVASPAAAGRRVAGVLPAGAHSAARASTVPGW